MRLAFEATALAAILAPAVYLFSRIASDGIRREIAMAAAASVVCFLATVLVVPNASTYLLKRGLKGKDLGKRGTPLEDREIPSALGLVAGVVYMTFIIVTQLVYAKDSPDSLATYNAALLSICFMVLLGFADDVLDLPWRYKLILPTVASLPLLCTYNGATTVVLPKMVRGLLWAGPQSASVGGAYTLLGGLVNAVMPIDPQSGGALVNLGLLYFVYMGMLAVFATNAINIYAGINGLEAGQALVIGVAILTTNLLELVTGADAASPHLFSALLSLPFIATTAGLLVFNTYPARVFVGDTYCYFAGMTFAVMGILGHFSKTLLLFFIPQIINFVYSLPQLFKVYPCPRHRLPFFDAAIGLLRPSTFTLPAAGGGSGGAAPSAASASNNSGPASDTKGSATPKPTVDSDDGADGGFVADGDGGSSAGRRRAGLRRRAVAGAAKAAPPAAADGSGSSDGSGAPAAPPAPPPPRVYDNFTLINLVLRLAGPMSERATVNVLLVLQVASCAAGLYARYALSYAFYDGFYERDRILSQAAAATPPAL